MREEKEEEEDGEGEEAEGDENELFNGCEIVIIQSR